MKLQVGLLIVSFLASLIAGLLVMPILKRLGVSQHIRDDGPESHLKKEGTPSMGGIIFLASMCFVGLMAMIKYPTSRQTLLILIGSTLIFGFIGFIDDYLKIKNKRSLGLYAWQKILLLLIASGAVTYCILEVLNLGTSTYIPFIRQFYDLNYYFFVPFAILVLLSTTNVVNITDGLDGLATGIIVVIMTFFTVLAISLGNNPVMIFSAIMTGACLGFLVYNMNPAKVFMGDTGSLALGGAIGAVSLVLQMPILLIFVAGVCVIEALSDIIQVVYFKLSHGKRVFKMAPLHHHLELSGWSEKKIVWHFWIYTIIFCVITFILL